MFVSFLPFPALSKKYENALLEGYPYRYSENVTMTAFMARRVQSISCTALVTVTACDVRIELTQETDAKLFCHRGRLESSVAVDILANDFDRDGDVLTITAVSGPANRSVTVVEGTATQDCSGSHRTHLLTGSPS